MSTGIPFFPSQTSQLSSCTSSPWPKPHSHKHTQNRVQISAVWAVVQREKTQILCCDTAMAHLGSPGDHKRSGRRGQGREGGRGLPPTPRKPRGPLASISAPLSLDRPWTLEVFWGHLAIALPTTPGHPRPTATPETPPMGAPTAPGGRLGCSPFS